MRNLRAILKNHNAEILGLLITAILLFLVTTSTRGREFTQQFFDGIRVTKDRDEVVVIGIDDKSLQSLGAWPFDRKIFADLTERLDTYGAKVIVYDVLFLEPRSGDEVFKNVLEKVTTHVVLASKLEKEVYFSSFLVDGKNSFITSALSNVQPDRDGKLRKYPLTTTHNEKCVVGLGQEAFRIFTFKTNEPCVSNSSKSIRYPQGVATYSLVDVLDGVVPSEKIKNKAVFIGSVSLDLEDTFVGMRGEKIPGVNFHASVFTSLLNKEGDRELGKGEIALLLLLFIVLTYVSQYYIRSIFGQIGMLLVLILLATVTSYGFFINHVVVPVPFLLISILVTAGYMTLVRFVQERKRSEHVQALFSKYVHKDVLKELMKSSASLNFSGERRDMSILFSDIRGFTSFSETMTPEELTTLLNAYLSAMTPPILNERGTIDKFIGDAVMAFWNAPLYVNDHATHAVKAALGMQKALADFNDKHKTTLAMGVGVNRGEVTVGNVGSQERVNYTVLGDAVNLASRIEGLTKRYGVLVIVTEAVKEVVHDKGILFRKLDMITVKGKAKPTLLYEARYRTRDDEIIFARYEEGFELYKHGKVKLAREIFEELAEKGDGPSELLLSRLEAIANHENWDGVWHFDEK